ncbi:hypothetical protein CROQUDRAFT_87782 [Cronartium quercuum f. sp. fusiforme G11]|uniref:Uncharacterized protein n=1 Tax=Cronartium quercuum f. sp. fusiforme G11 TaxID=708437 RepID=A0A9P6NS23_9BASI|nr:hypothetical protein CROQUDRAFT_87782 [Cronartium quercuum f. sp. fusiforme G11]
MRHQASGSRKRPFTGPGTKLDHRSIGLIRADKSRSVPPSLHHGGSWTVLKADRRSSTGTQGGPFSDGNSPSTWTRGDPVFRPIHLEIFSKIHMRSISYQHPNSPARSIGAQFYLLMATQACIKGS